MLGFIWLSFGSTDRITYGMQKVICAITSVPKPGRSSPVALNTATKSSIMEMPVTMSGLTMGILLSVSMTERKPLFIFLSPTAAAVPITVEAMAAMTATSREVRSASRIMLSRKRFSYHLSEKPFQTERLLL